MGPDAKVHLFCRLYKESMQGVRVALVQRTAPDKKGLLYVGEFQNGQTTNKMDHLVCFLAGMCMNIALLARTHCLPHYVLYAVTCGAYSYSQIAACTCCPCIRLAAVTSCRGHTAA